MSGSADDRRRGGAGSSSRAARPPKSVTLKFAGPPLSLPGEESRLEEDTPAVATELPTEVDGATSELAGEGSRRRADDTLREPFRTDVTLRRDERRDQTARTGDASREETRGTGERRRPSSDIRLDTVRADASHGDFVLRDSLFEQPLRLDTSELELSESVVPRSRDPQGSDELRLELDELDADRASAPEDGWGRLRVGDRPPSRPRSVTPPAMSRDDALDLVSRRSRPPSTPGIDLASEMADRYALGDYTGALRVAELVLGRNPEDPRAKRCAASSRERLLSLYSARLASLAGISLATSSPVELGTRIPRVRVPDHEIRWLGLDHRQGFLLSRLDGSANIDDLVDVSGMSRLEVLKTLAELVEVGAVSLG